MLHYFQAQKTFVHYALCKYTIQLERNCVRSNPLGWPFAADWLHKSMAGPQTVATKMQTLKSPTTLQEYCFMLTIHIFFSALTSDPCIQSYNESFA